MILLIDNYDSFSYNLYQLVGSINPEIMVVRNDVMPPERIAELAPEAIIISPGPGKPENAGNCIDIVKKLGREIPVLGVCLGHQVICTAFGSTVSYAKTLMHGKQSNTRLDINSPLFKGCPESVPVARYHSLAVLEDTITEELLVIAKAEDGEIMAVKHRDYEIYGVQFHPESIMTPDGKRMLKNFLDIAKEKKYD